MIQHGSDISAVDPDLLGTAEERVKQLKPIQTDETNITFVAEGCGDLPATRAFDENGASYIITAWEISPEELKKLQETGIIYLSVIGNGIPPVFLTADNPIIERTAEDGL